MATTYTLLLQPRFRSLLADGAPNIGGKVYTYAAGTTTLATTYSDPALTTANTNPVILDDEGQADIHFSGPYKVIVTDANGVQLYSADQLFGFKSDIFCSLPVQDANRLLAWDEVDRVFKNNDLDRRAVQFPESASATLPSAENRAGKLLYFGTAGEVETIPLETLIATINGAEDWGGVAESAASSDDWGSL